MSEIVFITGAGQGIGAGLTKVFLKTGYSVFATTRKPETSSSLKSLKENFPDKLTIAALDLENPHFDSELAQATRELSHMDILINNAGILNDQEKGDLSALKPEFFHKSFQINTIAPFFVIQKLLPLLAQSKNPRIVNITSLMGSIEDNSSGSYYPYRMSKAALNMLCKSLSLDLPEVTTINLHPGWVQTRMGGSAAPLSLEESVNGLFKVITGASAQQSGAFLDYRGNSLPW